MWTARTAPALALLGVLCGCRATPGSVEKTTQHCLGCIALYPGKCLPSAHCQPDLRPMLPRAQPHPSEIAPIEVRADPE